MEKPADQSTADSKPTSETKDKPNPIAKFDLLADDFASIVKQASELGVLELVQVRLFCHTQCALKNSEVKCSQITKLVGIGRPTSEEETNKILSIRAPLKQKFRFQIQLSRGDNFQRLKKLKKLPSEESVDIQHTKN